MGFQLARDLPFLSSNQGNKKQANSISAYLHGMFGKFARPFILFSTFATQALLSAAQTASVQFIHNSPDPIIETIDVWLNDSLWANDIEFLQSTPMLQVDTASLSAFEIRNALDSSIVLYSWNVPLPVSSKHLFVLHGQLNPQMYAGAASLDVAHFPQALELSASPSGIDILFFQGASEIDTADIAESELFELTAFDQLPYGEFSPYLNLFTADYGWSILDSQGSSVFGEYALPISELNWAGKAITIITGGFVNQSQNNNGQPLGMWATTRDGGPLFPLPPLQWNLKANVQFLHNSGLPTAGNIRIDTDGIQWQANLNMHEATPFLPFPAGKDVVISIHSNLLGSPLDSIWSDTLHLYSGGDYQLVWYGGDNPDNPAHLLTHDWENSPDIAGNELLLRFFNGSAAFNPISLLSDTLNLSVLAPHIAYGSMSDTLTLEAINEEWILFTENDSITAFQAPLDTLNLLQSNVTALTFPGIENNLPQLWISTAAGGSMHQLNTLVIPEPPVFCTVQLVHASADTLLQSIDVWINDSLIAGPILFESASEFQNIQCNDPTLLRIALHEEPVTILHFDTLQLEADQTHRLILWGIHDTQHYNPAPELDWYLDPTISLTSSASGNFDVRHFHATTDLGSLQLNEASTPIVPFFITTETGEMSNLQSLSAQSDYGIEILNAPTQFIFGTYALPANGLEWENKSITLISTGFRQPANNSNGEPFQIWALEPTGTMHALENFVHVSVIQDDSPLLVFPNPTSQKIQIQATTNQIGIAEIEIIDYMGNVVWKGTTIIRNGNIDELISLDSMRDGNYALVIEMNDEKRISHFCVVHR